MMSTPGTPIAVDCRSLPISHGNFVFSSATCGTHKPARPPSIDRETISVVPHVHVHIAIDA